MIDDLWQEDQRVKAEIVRLWERNAAFANGNQQFINSYSATAQITGGQFLVSQNQDTRNQMYMTNEIEPIMRTLVAYMTRAKPTVSIFPPDQSQERKNKAKVAERVIDAKYVLDNETQMSKRAAHYALCFGSAFWKDYWDSSAGRDAELPVYDEEGNEVIDEETGKVKLIQRKTGESTVQILTPMSIGFDWSYTDFERIPWIFEGYLVPEDWAREAYDRDEYGFTGKASEIKEGGAIGSSLTTLEQLKYSTPYTYGTPTGVRLGKKVLIREFYCGPTSELPRGRFIIKVGDLDVYDSWNEGDDLGSPYYMPFADVMWHPYTMFRYEEYIGRALGKSLVEGLIPQQMRLNEINGAILQNANTMAKSDWVAAENQLKRGIINGAGGNVFVYRPVPNAAPPTKVPGVPLPQQFFKEKSDLIEQMVRQAASNIGAQGQIPQGVTAASALELILENASSQLSDMMISWGRAHEQHFTKKLRIIRKFNDLPNEDLVDYIRTMSKDLMDTEINSFTGEDFGDGLVLKIEYDSMIPKSERAKREMYMELVKGPYAAFIGEDTPRGAELRNELMDKLGEKGFETAESMDVKKAKWENERMKKGLPPSLDPDDNDQIHLLCHGNDMKDPKYLERATPEIKKFYQQHVAGHKQQAAQKQQQAMQGMKPPPPKITLSLKGDASPQEIEQLAGFPPIPPPGMGPPMSLGSSPQQQMGPPPPVGHMMQHSHGNVHHIQHGAKNIHLNPIPAIAGVPHALPPEAAMGAAPGGVGQVSHGPR